MNVISISTATMSQHSQLFSFKCWKLAPFYVIVLTLCFQPASPAQRLYQAIARETFSQISF